MTIMRRVDDSCSAHLRRKCLVLDVPGCRVTHRLALSPSWWRALDAALELCSKPAASLWQKAADLNLLLDTLDAPLSGLERRIIYTQCMGELES